ncbi:AMP-binding protein, partial [Streptomyces sp. NPDC047022]|uniref:AMP-binding protein n=1 Tax=Streptomyces sp. NPDC047022 TaxID=3155737 RepID=UPI003405F135
VVAAVEGGVANVQDVYPLAPLQEGIFFHHLMATQDEEGGEAEAHADVYAVPTVLAFDSRARLDAFVAALQWVVDRHDIYRTAIVWEGLREPVQVVLRQVQLPVHDVVLDGPGDPVAQLLQAGGRRMDLSTAPLLRLHVAADPGSDQWLALLHSHHVVQDHTAMEVMLGEVRAFLEGQTDALPEPVPFRDFVAQARLGVPREEHERYFAGLLGDVEETTAPYGLLDVHGDGVGSIRAQLPVQDELAARVRSVARGLGVSAATVFHLACARVLAAVSGRDDVVFGTVLFGRMNAGAGADRVPGLFVNTLPVRVGVNASAVDAALAGLRQQMAELLVHEHAPLALAQQASGVSGASPLFTALFNYRHSKPTDEQSGLGLDGIRVLSGEGRTNYPLDVAVDDDGTGFRLTVDAVAPADAVRVGALLHTCLDNLVTALAEAPHTELRAIPVLDADERRQVVAQWNDTGAVVPDATLVELLAAQVARTPDAVALVCDGIEVSYAELDARANRLARHLMRCGVAAESVVGVCLERSVELVVALLGVVKAGGAYLPVDPEYPAERIALTLADADAVCVVTSEALAGVLPVEVERVLVDDARIAAESPATPMVDVRPGQPAYVIFTSGSTGRPKGVVVAHEGVVNRLAWMQEVY